MTRGRDATDARRAANWPPHTSRYYEALQGGTWATARISASVVYRHLCRARVRVSTSTCTIMLVAKSHCAPKVALRNTVNLRNHNDNI